MEQSPQQPQKIKERVKASAASAGHCEFTTTQERLTRALRSLGGVAGRNPALPILQNVLLKREQSQLRLSTTDLEVGVTAWLAGKLRGDGALTVPLRPLAEYVQNLSPGPVTLRFDQGSLTVTAEHAHAVFQGETAENFPLLPHLERGSEVSLPPKEAGSAFDAVLYAVATDDTRPELAGVLVRGEGPALVLAATDSYRLAESQVTLPAARTESFSLILPKNAAQEIRRALEGAESATLRIGEGQVLLLTAALHVVSRRVEGAYPDYFHIIPTKQPTSVEVERAELLRAIRASAVFSGNAVSRVTLDVGADALRVSATTPEMGETETRLPADVTGEPVTIAFNERFLRDALSSLTGGRVRIGFGTAATPAVFRAAGAPATDGDGTKGGQVLALIMPIKT